MSPSERDQLIERLPHRDTMLLLDHVDRVDERGVETRTLIDEQRCRLFGKEGVLEAYVGVELIAQSAALPLILDSEEGKDHSGMIVQVRSFQSNGLKVPAGSILKTVCEVELMLDGKVASVKGKVSYGDDLLCEGVLTLAVRSD